MNINYFFLFFFFTLAMILLVFKPMEVKQRVSSEVPLFTISAFTMHEIDKKGLTTYMNGQKATRYTDRYAVERMDYTDNSREFIANMKSDSGIYKDEIVYLEGNIVYIREDGITFKTQKATYDKKTTVARADEKYILYKGNNTIEGRGLIYDSSLETIRSNNIKAVYQLQESKK